MAQEKEIQARNGMTTRSDTLSMTETTEIPDVNDEDALIEDIRADRVVSDTDQLAKLLVGWRREMLEE